MIDFNLPPSVGNEIDFIKQAILNHKISGDGVFTHKCTEWLKAKLDSKGVFLTTSCTHALEMAALLCDIKPYDEVIMPSYTFVSTANAFVLRGAKIVFVDIRPDTLNIDETKIEAAITKKTKAIVPVHYAGVSCDMDTINNIAQFYNLIVIEDAAQALMSNYRGNPVGSYGDFACFSFHETKNYSMGEGGALIVKNKNLIEKAEILREKGTNRSKFFRGQIDKYTWVDKGSSYLPSDINAAFLWAQLKMADTINENRLKSFNCYLKKLKPLEDRGYIELPKIPKDCTHNAHMFYIKTKNLDERTSLINWLNKNDIQAVFHYVPLHLSPAGKKYGRFYGKDVYTTKESERTLRLPIYYGFKETDLDKVVRAIFKFYNVLI